MDLLFLILLFVIGNFIFYLNYQRISLLINLYDYPDNIRKNHLKPIPLIGGFQLILNICLLYVVDNYFDFMVNEIHLGTLTFFGTLVYVLGFLDDKFDIKVTLKFVTLLLIILSLVIFNENLLIKSLYFETFDKNINIEKISLFFTILCFLLFMNACNMFDGVNLQLSLYSTQVLIFFLFNNFFWLFSTIITIYILFFILLNKDGKIFLGDSGSLLIGFVIAYIVISQYNLNISILSCEKIFLIMFLPGIDMFRLFVIRLKNRKNPFKPDRNHIHHLMGRRFTFIESTAITQFYILCGLLFSNYLQPIFLIISLLAIYIIMIYYLYKSAIK